MSGAADDDEDELLKRILGEAPAGGGGGSAPRQANAAADEDDLLLEGIINERAPQGVTPPATPPPPPAAAPGVAGARGSAAGGGGEEEDEERLLSAILGNGGGGGGGSGSPAPPSPARPGVSTGDADDDALLAELLGTANPPATPGGGSPVAAARQDMLPSSPQSSQRRGGGGGSDGGGTLVASPSMISVTSSSVNSEARPADRQQQQGSPTSTQSKSPSAREGSPQGAAAVLGGMKKFFGRKNQQQQQQQQQDSQPPTPSGGGGGGGGSQNLSPTPKDAALQSSSRLGSAAKMSLAGLASTVSSFTGSDRDTLNQTTGGASSTTELVRRESSLLPGLRGKAPPAAATPAPAAKASPPRGGGATGWEGVEKLMDVSKPQAAFKDIVGDLSLKGEKTLLQQIIEDMDEEDISTVADSDLGLNDDLLDVDAVLRNAERIANSKKMKGSMCASTTYMGPAVPTAGLAVLRQTNFTDFSAELSTRRNDVGWPVCLAAAPHAQPIPKRNNAAPCFAVGTSYGVVLLFTAAGKRCGIVGGVVSNESPDRGGCTCVDIFPTGESLVAGFQTGEIVIFDTGTGQARHSLKKDETKVSGPIHSVRFFGAEPNRIALLDIFGHCRVMAAKKALFRGQDQVISATDTGVVEIDTVCINPPVQLQGTVEPQPILAVASRSALRFYKHKSSEPFYQYENPHYVSAKAAHDHAESQPDPNADSTKRNGGIKVTSSRVTAVNRKEQLLAEARRKRERLRLQRAEALPCMSWLERVRNPELVVIWNDFLSVFRVDAASALEGNPRVIPVSHHLLRHAAVACVYMSLRVVCLIDSHGSTVVIDPRVESSKATADIGLTKVEPAQTATKDERIKSCRQAVRGFVTENSAALLTLSKQPTRVMRMEVISWKERLEALAPSRDALRLASAMKGDTAVAVVGLPYNIVSRERVLQEVIADLLRRFMFAQADRGPSHGMDTEHWWRTLGTFTFKFCCNVGNPRLIFTVLYEFFARAGVANIWISLLEPCILDGSVKGVPDNCLHMLAEWLATGGVLAFQRTDTLECSKGNHLDIAYSLIINPRTFTVDVWVKTRDSTSEMCAICSVDDGEFSGWALLHKRNVWCFQVGDGSDWTMLFDEKTEDGSHPGWTRVTAKYDSGEASLYVDGMLVGQTQDVVFQPNTKFPLRIGAYVQETQPGTGILSSSKEFKGDVRDIRLYSTAHHDPFTSMLEDWAPSEASDDDPFPHATHDDLGNADDDPNVLIDDVASVVSESDDEKMETILGGLRNCTRLDHILLRLDQAEMRAVGGSFATVLSMAERLHLYKSFVACHNKSTSDGFIAPLAPLYSLISTPVEGSRVEYANQQGQGIMSGTVVGTEGAALLVRWETTSTEGVVTKVQVADLVPLPDSIPNLKATHVLLSYLKHLLKGKTFYGVDIPQDQLLSVKVQALYVLFQYIEDSADKKVANRDYKVLSDLLHANAKGVIEALQVAFSDDNPMHSPWRKILRANMRPATLVDSPSPESRFNLTRDQVVAVLFKIMGVYESKPFEPQVTFAREWPKPADMVALFKLVARGIAREVVQPKKFKDPKDSVKRIVSHLAHRCESENEAEKTERQQLIEGMLAVALSPAKECWKEQPTEEDSVQLRKVAEEAGFVILQIYLYKREANYSAVLRTYIQAHEDSRCSIEKSALFDFLEESLESVKENPLLASHVQNLEKAVLSHLQTLVKIDPNKAAQLVVKYLQANHDAILDALESDKKTQYAYLKGLMEAANTQEDDVPPGLFDASTLETYIKLLCIYEDSQLLPFIREHEDHKLAIPKILKCIENTKVEEAAPPPPLDVDPLQASVRSLHPAAPRSGDGREDAIVYLYSRIGKFTDALDLLFRRLQAKMQEVRVKLIHTVRRDIGESTAAGNLSSYADSPLMSYPGMRGRARTLASVDDTHRSFIRCSSEYSDKTISVTQEIFESREGKAVSDLIGLGLELCADSMRNGTEDITVVWFSLLEKFIKPKKILVEVEMESRELMKAESIVVSALALATGVTLSMGWFNRVYKHAPETGMRMDIPAELEYSPDSIIDELHEVQIRDKEAQRSQMASLPSNKNMPFRRAVKAKTRKLLTKSLSPALFVVNLRMQEIYTYYITKILLSMMGVRQIGPQPGETELNDFRKKVEKYRLQTQGMPKGDESHANFKNMRDELNRRSQRVEMVILKKIIGEHADGTFAEFKVVLLGILENARFEASLQRAFHRCLEQDMYRLKRRQLQASQQALCPTVLGAPPWAPQCCVCRGRLSEKNHVPGYMCGHVFHRDCAKGRNDQVSQKCPICFGMTKAKNAAAEGGGGKQEASKQPADDSEVMSFNKKTERRLNQLSIRLRNRRLPEFLASLSADDADGEADSAPARQGVPLLDTAPGAYLSELLEEEAELLGLPPPPAKIVPGKLSVKPEFEEEVYCDLVDLVDEAIMCD